MGRRWRARERRWKAEQRAERAAWNATRPDDPALDELVAEAESLGYTVTFQRFVEDAETPGLLGQKRGVCIRAEQRIKVALDGASVVELSEVLAHEIRHARGAEHAGDCPELGLRCGGRVNGWGDPV